MATKQEIITRFRLYIDDTSELSSQEESDLFDKVYQMVCENRPWEFLRTTFSGTQSTSVDYVALPANFGYLLQNGNYTEESMYASQGPVVFVGANYSPYTVVSISDRRQYRNQDNFAYIDIPNSQLHFTLTPVTANPIEFDYAKVPDNLGDSDTPIFPARFQDILYHAMCVDSFIIQQSDKAKSYAKENQAKFESYLSSMALWNSRLVQV